MTREDDLISRQSVLAYIDRITHHGFGKRKSFEYLEKYVQKLPSAQPNVHDLPKDADTISRQAAIEALRKYFTRLESLKRNGLNTGEKAIALDVVGELEHLTSAQPEETCDTCTHWHFKNTRYEDWQCECCRMSYHPNYYERRTDE